MSDIELGKAALSHFHTASTKYSAYQFKSVSELIAAYGKNADLYLDGVGMVISLNNLSDRQVQSAMMNLAIKSQGKVPKDHQGYNNALGNKAGEISYLDLTKTVVKDVVTESVDGLAKLGDSLQVILKVVTVALPFVAGYIAYKYVIAKGKSFK